MPDLDAHDALRTRLATESILAQKQRELAQANSRIAERAKVLTDEVIERRSEAEEARTIADRERSRHLEAATNLRRAKSDMVIAERRLWTSLETMSDGFAVFDRDTRVVAANAAFFLPYGDMECVKIGITYGELVNIAIEEGLVNPGEISAGDWTRWMLERWETATIPPATIRFWNNQFVRLSERRTPDGDVVMMGVNITRQIRRQKVLEEARRRAEAANRAKSAFLANMSHEIRTPMNGVLAMADLMAEGPLDEEQKLCLDTIRNSGQALLVIINDVLDYSKIEAQKLSVEMSTFDLEAAINEVTTLLMPTAREKNLSLIVDYDMFLPTRFNGDKGRIRQILMNLVGNAVKFTHEGHVAVRVVGLPDLKPDHYRLHVTVEDTGIGIPEEMREHIFGEFNQVQSEMTRQFDGTGLGLAITRRLVALMGGDMWVDNGAESGSVFGFRLTMRKEGPDIEGLRGRFGQRRVVLHDPNPQSRDVMLKQMRALGLRPEAVSTPDEVTPATLAPEDIAMLCDDQGIYGTVEVGTGPDFRETSVSMPRPILRETLLEALTTVTQEPEHQVAPAHPNFDRTAPTGALPDHRASGGSAPDVLDENRPNTAAEMPEAALSDQSGEGTPPPPLEGGTDGVSGVTQDQTSLEAPVADAKALPETAENPSDTLVLDPGLQAETQAENDIPVQQDADLSEAGEAALLTGEVDGLEDAVVTSAPPVIAEPPKIVEAPEPETLAQGIITDDPGTGAPAENSTGGSALFASRRQPPAAEEADPCAAKGLDAANDAPQAAAEQGPQEPNEQRATSQDAPPPTPSPEPESKEQALSGPGTNPPEDARATAANPTPSEVTANPVYAPMPTSTIGDPEGSSEPAALAAGQPSVTTGRPAPFAKKVRVLAAEDNKTNQLVLTKLLKNLDIDLEIVANGRLALESFKFELPDIVFTDISMPEMNGMDAARAMRSHAKENGLPPVPIIAMTAHAVDGNEQEILAAGIDYYLTKPLKKDVLVDHILAAAPLDAAPPLPADTAAS
ncbi:MAG: ATP-binding protein [Pseudomonadota bacterium]